MPFARAMFLFTSFCIGGLFPTISAASEQLEERFGVPNSERPEYADFAYLRGDWDVQMVIVAPSGERREIPNKAHMTGFYHREGKIFQSCFVASDFFSTDIRAFDEEAKEWRAHFLNANAQRWSGFSVKKIGDTVQSIAPGGFSGKEEFDVKSIASEMTDTSFRSRVYRSNDEGETWVQTFELSYTKSNPAKGSRINC